MHFRSSSSLFLFLVQLLKFQQQHLLIRPSSSNKANMNLKIMSLFTILIKKLAVFLAGIQISFVLSDWKISRTNRNVAKVALFSWFGHSE